MISKPGKGYGLAKPSQKTDIRMVHSEGKANTKHLKNSERKQKTKWLQLIKKHIFKFN
jgi:hypothetical protein